MALGKAEAVGTDAQGEYRCFHVKLGLAWGPEDGGHEGARETRMTPGFQPVLKPAGK